MEKWDIDEREKVYKYLDSIVDAINQIGVEKPAHRDAAVAGILRGGVSQIEKLASGFGGRKKID